MVMQISIKDFRCFHQTEIDIRPINILVGENSSGKTSLLAAVRFLLDLFHSDAKASFNKDPFYLGSYEQIAHFRGGRFGRAKEFSFCIKGTSDREPILRRLIANRRLSEGASAREATTELPEDFELSVCFYNNRSQPAISNLSFKAGQFSYSAQLKDNTLIEFSTPGHNFTLPDRKIARALDPFIYDLSSVDFLLREIRFLPSEKGELDKNKIEQSAII